MRALLSAAVWLTIWEVAALLTGEELLLPTPRSVVLAFSSLAVTGEFYAGVFNSVLRVLVGLIAGVAVGVILGTAMYFSKTLNAFFAPAVGAVKAAPVASFIILLFVWFSTGKVVGITSLLIVLPVITANVSSGLGSADGLLLEMAGAFNMSRTDKIRYIYAPSALPSFRAGLRTATGMAWKAGIAAEVICRPRSGLGTEIYDAKVYLDTPSLFAWTLTVILLSILFEKLFSALLDTKRGTALSARRERRKKA